MAAIAGVPVSALAWGFLALVSKLQHWLYASLPSGLGLHPAPEWWPFPLLFIGGALVALLIRYLPGTGGHSPADGFRAGGVFGASEIPGIALAALATLGFGAVLGPESPLIALGGAVSAWAVSRAKAGPAPQVRVVVAAAGSFAAISTLLGSPIIGAFLLMEVSGIGGAALELVMLPGLLAAGIGSLIFIGLGHWTGLGTFSLALPHLPHFATPDLAEFGWALVIGVAAAPLGVGIHRLALLLRSHVERRMLLLMPVVGLAVAGLAIAFAEGSGKSTSEVLFSGQNQLGPFILHSAGYTAGALVLLLACKGLAYGASLSSFRGGPIFPSMFLGAAGGMALSHLPGLPLVPAVAMGIGAMSTVMLRLPLTSALLPALLLSTDGLAVTPLIIVAVVVAYLVSARLAPAPHPAAQAAPGGGDEQAPIPAPRTAPAARSGRRG